MKDRLLLEQYVRSGSEAAFAEFTRRHHDFIYSTALRQVRDPHLASDVAQNVLLCVARKADSLMDEQALAGWLCKATRFEALKLLRERGRRSDREHTFAANNDGHTSALHPLAEDEAAAHLHVALDSLRPKDREALVVRFLRGKSVRETAAALGITEDAAEKRLTRAVERLRVRLRRRGLSGPAATAALALHGMTAPGAIVAGASAATSASAAIPLSLSPFLFMTKVKIAAAAIAIAGLTAAPFIVQHRANEARRRERSEIETQHRLELERVKAAASVTAQAADRSERIEALQARIRELNTALAKVQTPPVERPARTEDTVAAIKQRALSPQNAPEERLGALRRLRELNARDQQVAAAMATLARTTTDPRIRADIFRQLSGVVEPSLKLVMLEALKQDGATEVRQEAAESLRAFRSDPEVYAELAAAAREDTNAEVREQAAEAMLKGAPASVLQQVLQDSKSTEAELYFSVESLRKLQGPNAEQAKTLLRVMNGRATPKMREDAVEDLGRHYAAVPGVTEWLRQIIESDSDPRVQQKAEEALRKAAP